MDNNNFKVGDIVYTGWRWRGETAIHKCNILKINPKTYNIMYVDIYKNCEFNVTRGHRVKHIFKTEKECYNFLNPN